MWLRGIVPAGGAMGRRIDSAWWPPLNYFSFQPVIHDWFNKGRGMCYPVCGMVHIKKTTCCSSERVAHVAAAGFLSLSEWSFTICPKPYNCKQNVLSASLNKIFSSFFLSFFDKSAPLIVEWSKINIRQQTIVVFSSGYIYYRYNY